MIIVKSEHQSTFENDYLNEFIIPKSKNIFVNTKQFFDLEKDLIKNSKILIIFSPGNEEVNQDIKIFIKRLNMPFVLIHLSDESLTDTDKYYLNAELILRSYFNPSIKNKKTYTIPVGFQNGFFNLEDTYSKGLKEFKWVFFGQIYSTRKNMLDELSLVEPNYIFETKEFFSVENLSVDEMKSYYSKSIFAPCPFGFINPDTFRIMESLESGCIPIVQKFKFIDYYKYVFGNHPFIIVRKWKDAPKIIDKYLRDESRLEEKQKEVSEWYKSFKIDLSKDLLNLIENKNEPLNSKQFFYQKQNIMNFFRRLIFFYWFKLRKYMFYIKFSKMLYRLKKRLQRNN